MNRTRNYECMCLLDNAEVRKGWEPLKEAVAGLFTKHEAKVLSNRRWDLPPLLFESAFAIDWHIFRKVGPRCIPGRFGNEVPTIVDKVSGDSTNVGSGGFGFGVGG